MTPSMRPPGAGGYRLLDSGRGRRLEEWGPYRLARPDPTALWPPSRASREWSAVDAEYVGRAGGGRWVARTPLPPSWPVALGGLRLLARLAPYKHTGIFPEHHPQWEWMRRAAAGRRSLAVLNLFAYTGGATVALALAGHVVTHVDASKPALAWARENAALNELPATAVRWIQDDAAGFVAREARRGRRYDAVLLDPPAVGHGPRGGRFEVSRDLPALLAAVAALLSDAPAFVAVNTYTERLTPEALRRLVAPVLRNRRGRVEAGELALEQVDGRRLTTGTYARWRGAGAA
jgi:23S rRNA (cytosine1962-C5)-methyltransferase